MCSLAAMPELLLSHSPPDFYYRSRYTPPPPPKPAPSRPCLASPPPRAPKKKVVFADDKGYSLTQVRVMREPSNAPPTWSMQFLAQVMRDLEPSAVAAAANEAASVTAPAGPATAAAEPERWVPEFAQPASDYLQFRERLDSANVSLENVIVRDAEGVFTGTVKVRNLSFHKEVALRWTADDWQSHHDELCTYVENPVACSSAYVLYDTFSFRVPLPSAVTVTSAANTTDSRAEQPPPPTPPTTSSSRRVEFCVCFRCDGREYWDNNGGVNYALVRKAPGAGGVAVLSGGGAAPASVASGVAASGAGAGSGTGQGAGKFQDALRAKLDSWSEFASWNHLVTEGPYW